MKLITTIYPGEQIEATLTIQSRVSKDQNDKSRIDGPLITKYRSRIGNESLIFNPSVVMILRGRGNNKPDAPTAWIPLTQFYRFTACLSHVYQKLQTEKLFTFAEGTMYMDKKVAMLIARKVPLFRNTLVVSPATTTDRAGKPAKGVEFSVDGVTIGIMEHNEALGLIDIIDHFDITTFSLLSGLVDKLEAIDSKLDYMVGKLEAIEALLKANPVSTGSTNEPMLKWEVVGI